MENKTRYFFGEWKDSSKPLTTDDVADLCRKANEQRKKLQGYPADKVMRLLDKVRAKWNDPTYPRLAYLREKLPSETGFSPAMIELGIQELVWVLDSGLLKQKVDGEMKNISPWPAMQFRAESQSVLRREPLGTVLHVLSGNVFLVGAGSLMEGLITGNVTILKMSSNEKVFLPQLIESFLECDEDGIVSRSVALVDYASSQKEVIAEFKKRVDGIVVWGGEEAVKAYRNDLPARTRLIMFGPKLSVAIVTKSGFDRFGVDHLAQKLAAEMAIWDQNACTAPQLCYVQNESNARALVERMSIALDKANEDLPPGEVDLNTAVEIQKLRSVALVAEARGLGALRTSPKGVDWTVTLERDRTIEPSPLHRTLKIVPYETKEEIFSEMEKLRGYLQTLGLAASVEEGIELSGELGAHGALRVLELGQMSGGEIDDPHDGSYDLPQLVNFVVTRLPQAAMGKDPRDYLSSSERSELVNSRLRVLVDRARKSKFYGERFKNVTIDTVADLLKVPRLTRDEMDENMPPKGDGLCTGEFHGGYVSRSGGSTGEPKFSIYDAHDWESMISEATRVLRAAGLAKGDRVANCMMAGDLYGSFVSFDHINYRVGAMTFAFAGEVSPEVLLDTWRKFKLNCIQAIPTILVPLLRAVKRLEPNFTLEKIIYAGTPLSPSDRQWLTTNLGTKRISSIIGANDGGQLAFQCEALTGAKHHLIDDFNYVEILDEEGQPVAAGTPGRIVITSLLKYAFPLIRYELGDAGRVLDERCECGRTARVIEYLGRSDDTICVASMNLRYRDFLAAISGYEFTAMQLAARNSEAGEFLVMRLESDAAPEGFEKRVYDTVVERVPKIKDRLKDKTLLRIEVEWHASGTLPRNSRSGKIKTLVDERK